MSDPDRLEREIEEILGRIDEFPDAGARRRRTTQRLLRQAAERVSDAQRSVMRTLARFSVSQVMLLSFLLILGSLFFRRVAPPMMAWVLYAGIVLFVSSFAIMVFGGRRASTAEPTWRGRPIRTRTTASPGERLRRWWRERTRS